MSLDYRNVDYKVVLLIVDGFGTSDIAQGNAIKLSNMPTWNYLTTNYPIAQLAASGNSVGLPNGVMGNSEVGHLTIGTGRITYQSLELINQACNNDILRENPNISGLVEYARLKSSKIHLMGLLSDGGVHSHQDHLNYLIDLFNEIASDMEIYIHVFTDGRDTPPDSSVKYLERLFHQISDKPNIKIATIIGRYYVMDRDNKWERTEIAFNLLTKGVGESTIDPISLIHDRYNTNETDEFLRPILVDREGLIEENDSVLFFNFRPDRARQITMSLSNLYTFENFLSKPPFIVTMTSYDDSWDFPVLFETPNLKDSLSEIVSNMGFKQVHIAETEKYAHVTYFLNGGHEPPFENEKRILIPSLKVATYDLQPEMSTKEIISTTVNEIKRQEFELIVVNIAAPDMVGHTGNLNATIQALEIFDRALGSLIEICKSENYCLIITADHGNCEKMLDNGKIHTAHTTNTVPMVIVSNYNIVEQGGLRDVAPTVLDILGLPKSNLMDGTSLIIR